VGWGSLAVVQGVGAGRAEEGTQVEHCQRLWNLFFFVFSVVGLIFSFFFFFFEVFLAFLTYPLLLLLLPPPKQRPPLPPCSCRNTAAVLLPCGAHGKSQRSSRCQGLV
jgi:hypothetical protein